MGVLDHIVGRQPIFDRDSSVLGYELQFRAAGPEEWSPSYTSASLVPVETLYTALGSELDRLIGDRSVFVRATEDLLTGAIPLTLPPERTVIGIHCPHAPDEALLWQTKQLLKFGYTVAVEGIDRTEGLRDILVLSSFAKLDTEVLEPEVASRMVRDCHGLGIRTIAGGIDLRQQLRECVNMGFDYFEGYLLATPQLIPGRTLEPSHFARVRLAAKLLDREAQVSELEQIVRTDPALATQLLELAGLGAAGGMRRTVRSIHEALVLVGWRRLQTWLSLLLMTNRGETSDETFGTALVRARMCELLVRHLDPARADEAFTAGLLSSLDLLLGVPITEALGYLPLDESLRNSIVLREGMVGAILSDAVSIQTGHYTEATRSGLGPDRLQIAYVSSLSWFNETFSGGWAQPA